jgi:penicillin-binding protein 1C
MLANGGVKRPLRARLDAPAAVGTRLLSDEASFMALDALRTGHARPGQGFTGEWTRDALPISWKTGTSHGYRDAWCAGVFGPYVLVVWVGNFDGQSNPAFVGLDSAAPLFFELVDAIRSERPEIARVALRPPTGVTRVKVCAISGDLPGPHCQHTVSTWFIPGRSPIKVCDVHREVWVDSRTGQRTCEPGPFARAEVYEFWPSDLLKLFRQAGMPRRLPPGGGDACSLDARASHGNPPQITSPENGIDYAVRMSALGTQTLPLAAVTDADVHALYWFLDEHLVGTSGVREPLFWRAQPGSYVVRVVDDQGRSDARELKVTLVK